MIHRIETQERGQPAGAIGRVEDLVVEDREVEGQPEANGVCGRQLC